MRKILFTIALALLATTAVNAQKAVKYNQYGVAVESDVLDVEAQDGILVFESPKSGYKFWFDVRAQADAAVFFGAPDYADAIGNGTQIRRARFAVKGQINKDWYGEFDMDLANGLAELKDAIVRYTGVPNLDLQVGNFKENFSIQRNTTSRYLQFIERPMVCSALTPSRHLGFNAKYAKDWLWVSAGAFSQVIAGQEEWTNVADNNKDFGRNSGYSLTTKVVFRPLYKMDNASLHIGAAYSYRTTTTDLATGEWGTYRASCRNSTSINRKKYVDTNNLPGFDHNNLWTVELAGTDSVTRQPMWATTCTSRATPPILLPRTSADGMYRPATFSSEASSSTTPEAASTPRWSAAASGAITNSAPAMKMWTSTTEMFTAVPPKHTPSASTGM